ncbi:hypothetical protein TNCT_629471 [Trichonephila clavata]|uniref:Uncharacterized protein n=1 Tax=Trichonephila clavata TaxID=2740835 RepID=A0A8X6GNK3_TRICU|nr:hypothetical protein TNCT_629471 [Trichonephila clavata]
MADVGVGGLRFKCPLTPPSPRYPYGLNAGQGCYERERDLGTVTVIVCTLAFLVMRRLMSCIVRTSPALPYPTYTVFLDHKDSHSE